MKKVLLTLAVATVTFLTATAQNPDLVFDNTFDSGNPSVQSLGNPNYSISTYGGMKQVNDSVFVYFANYADWTNMQFVAETRAITTHNDGTVEYTAFFNQGGYFTGDPNDFFITDIVVNPSSEQVFVVQNAIWDDGGTDRRCVRVIGHQYDGFGFPTIVNWGISGSGISVISAPGVDMTNAKGSLISGYPCLAYSYGSYSSPQVNVAFSILGTLGAFTGFSVITSNAPSLYSQVADVIAISNSEIYIADNAYTNSSSTINDYARILKWNGSALDNTYAGGDGIADILWNNQTNTPFVQDQINHIYYVGGKITAVGTSREDISAPYTPVHGKVTRLNSDGTGDNTFGTSGTFAPDFSATSFRTYFNDIDVASDGFYYLSGSHSMSDSPNSPDNCFLLVIDVNGAIQTTKGNNGFLFDNEDYNEIVETVIIPGGSALEDKFVFNGLKDYADPDPSETAVGRLVWSNGSTGVNEFASENGMSIYPNPVSAVLNISVKESTNIRIVNLLGATVISATLNQQHNSIDVSGLTSGVYFIYSDKDGVLKFVKE